MQKSLVQLSTQFLTQIMRKLKTKFREEFKGHFKTSSHINTDICFHASLLAILAFAPCVLPISAYATVDGNDRAYLVVKDLNSGMFFVERAPIIGCYGLAQGPRLAQFTSPYMVNKNIGCGEVTQENVNELVCAKLVSYKETPDYMGFSEITLNISNCPQKTDPQFIKTLRLAAKLNFPLKKRVVHLILIK